MIKFNHTIPRRKLENSRSCSAANPSEKTTSARIHELSKKKNEKYEELSEIKRREKSLQEKVTNARSIYDEPSRAKAKKKEQELG